MPEEQKSFVKFGTCSWNYDSWNGIVYAANQPVKMLTEYAGQFQTVEIDQWFWSLYEQKPPVLPKKETVASYSQSVHADFQFTVKMPNSLTLTHYYATDKTKPLLRNPHFLSKDLLSRFCELLSPLQGKLGPLMLQFEYLNKQKMPALEVFIARLHEFFEAWPAGFIPAIETRNPNFLTRQYFEFLKQRNIVPVFLQGYYMPSVFPLIEKYLDWLPETIVLRLHGPDRSGIEQITGNRWNKIVAPKDEEIEMLVRLLEILRRKRINVYVNVNNHYEGSAPLTINRILKQIAAQ
jgi:uncharacterized protein YecE (DUF72 family)